MHKNLNVKVELTVSSKCRGPSGCRRDGRCMLLQHSTEARVLCQHAAARATVTNAIVGSLDKEAQPELV